MNQSSRRIKEVSDTARERDSEQYARYSGNILRDNTIIVVCLANCNASRRLESKTGRDSHFVDG